MSGGYAEGMTILLLIVLVALASVVAGVARHRVATVAAAAVVVLAAYLLELHVSVAGALFATAAGLLIGLPVAAAALIALAIMHPWATLLDAARRRTGHSRIGLAVAMVRLLVAGRRLMLR
jgi:hypothetical protein